MAPAAHELCLGAFFIDGALLLNEGRSGLEGNAKNELFTVANTALNPTRAVRLGTDFAAFIDKNVVVFGSQQD